MVLSFYILTKTEHFMNAVKVLETKGYIIKI